MQLPLVVLLAACVALSAAQRFASPNPNNVDEYDYEDAGAQHLRPQPRSYAPNQARLSASQPRSTPVPILKQINRHNDDGSYTYGYEGADGSFKIETKLVTGEVMGKYGYVDDSGKVRTVEYGANRYGFQPAGEGITVAPPTLVDETRTQRPKAGNALSGLTSGSLESQEDIYDDGQYYEEPSTAAPVRAPVRVHRPQPQPQPQRPRFQTPQYFENSFSSPAAAERPSPLNNAFAHFSQSTDFSLNAGPARPAGASRFGSSSSVGPVPARAQVSGAVLAGPSPPFRPLAPAPVREPQSSPPQPQALFVPSSQLSSGLGRFQSSQAPVLPRRQPSASGSGGLLDQLARDYALPQNSAQPLVDTSFGVY